MRQFILIIACILIAESMHAHNALLARFDLELVGNKGLLHAQLTQAGVDAAMMKFTDNKIHVNYEDKAYKELIVRYIKEHILIVADGKKLTIGEGGLRLGNHQSDLKFIVDNVPDDIKSLVVRNTAFEENEHHQSIVNISYNGQKVRLILQDANDFERCVLVEENQLTISQLSTVDQQELVLGSSLVLMGLVIVVLMSRKSSMALNSIK